MTTYSMSRREFARLFAMGGSAAILSHQTLLGSKPVRTVSYTHLTLPTNREV